jgi:1-acyl-sn-glycerol-3-phosphate acyltransferase
MDKQIPYPLMIFPEGTVTNGRYVLKLKKGAFHSLLPIKPMVIHTTNPTFDVSVGSSSLFLHFIRTLCYVYHNITVIELPVIKPNNFMYENYPNKKITEKWEIYAEVARDILCEVGNFGKSESTLRDNRVYYDIVMREKRIWKDVEGTQGKINKKIE